MLFLSKSKPVKTDLDFVTYSSYLKAAFIAHLPQRTFFVRQNFAQALSSISTVPGEILIMHNFGGQKRCIMGDLQMANN